MNAKKYLEESEKKEKIQKLEQKVKDKLYKEYMENQRILHLKSVDSKSIRTPRCTRRVYFLPPGQNWDKETKKRIEIHDGFIDFCKNQTEKEKRKWEKRKEKEKEKEKEE